MSGPTINCSIATTIAIILLFVGAISVQSTRAQDETLETVIASWRKREEVTRSVKLVMTEDHFTGKGTMMGGPPRDLETQLRLLVVLEGNNMRHERIGEVWAPDAGGLANVAMYAVNDGIRSKQLFRTTRNDDVLHSTGWVENRPKHVDVRNGYIAPVLWHFRPISANFGPFNLRSLRVVSHKEQIDGVRCILLEEPTTVPGRVLRYWVAPDKEMSVIRHAMPQGDVVLHQTDVSFRRDPKHGWLPTKWKTISFKDGATFSAGSISVSECEVNFAVPVGTFDIDFPAGVKVHDRILKKTYIVKPDRTERRIMQREMDRGATYTQLLHSQEGSLGQTPTADFWARMRKFTIIGAVLASLVVLAVLVGKRNWFTR